MTDLEIRAALTDLPAVAITLDAEGRGDSRQGGSSVEERIAIGCVIRNRVKTPRRFSATYRGVCLQRLQFSCWQPIDGAANYVRTMALARALVEGTALPMSKAEIDLVHESLYLAEGIIGGQLLDRVAGATHYMTSALFRSKPPAWVKGLRPCAEVGTQVFFSGVA